MRRFVFVILGIVFLIASLAIECYIINVFDTDMIETASVPVEYTGMTATIENGEEIDSMFRTEIVLNGRKFVFTDAETYYICEGHKRVNVKYNHCGFRVLFIDIFVDIDVEVLDESWKYY